MVVNSAACNEVDAVCVVHTPDFPLHSGLLQLSVDLRVELLGVGTFLRSPQQRVLPQ